jgi:hypothetical protein
MSSEATAALFDAPGPPEVTAPEAPGMLGAVERALNLLRGLDYRRGTDDLERVQAGLKHELAGLHVALSALTGPVGEDRPGLVRNDARRTSRDAAAGCTITGTNQRGRILTHLLATWGAGLPGSTDETMTMLLHLYASSQRPRRVELVRMGLVEDSGKTERVASGREAVLWRLTEKGRVVAAQLNPPPLFELD